MSVVRYKVNKVFSNQEALILSQGTEYQSGIHQLEVNDRVLDWMKKINISQDNLLAVPYYDWKMWIDKNPQYADFGFGDYVLGEKEDNWFEMIDLEGKSILFDADYISNDSELLKKMNILTVGVEQVGSMSKPFRHFQTPTHLQGDTLVITVTNFSDKGEQGFKELKKIDEAQTKECNVIIFDVNQAILLQKYTNNTKAFENEFIEGWENNHFIQFNW